MTIADLLLPHRCPICRRAGPAPCPACVATLPAPPELPPPPGIDLAVAVVAYRGSGRALVADLKFLGRRGALRWVAGELGRGLTGVARLDAVTWVPTTAARRRRRGVDQAEVLARAVAARLDRPIVSLLRRRPGPPQAGRGAAERLVGPPLVARRAAPPGVLVVDDVLTTGGSLAAAARVLRGAGAEVVVAATVARTPPGGAP